MLKPGDAFWSASYGMIHVAKTCPVCYGKLCVTLILGNGDRIELPCDYCGRGWEGPKGVVYEYEMTPEVKIEVVQEVRVEERIDGKKIEYVTYDHHVVSEDMAYAIKEDAEKECALLIIQREHEETTRAEYIKKNLAKSYSWNAGYHLREAKREEESAVRHRAKAKLCKEKENPPC